MSFKIKDLAEKCKSQVLLCIQRFQWITQSTRVGSLWCCANTVRAAQHPTKGAGRLRCLPPGCGPMGGFRLFCIGLTWGARKQGKKGEKAGCALVQARRGGTGPEKPPKCEVGACPYQDRQNLTWRCKGPLSASAGDMACATYRTRAGERAVLCIYAQKCEPA